MEFIFDTLALAPKNSSDELLSSLSIPDFSTLTQWSTSLTDSEQSQIYRIENAEILNDLHESLTAAFLLFNLDSEYEDHSPIKWTENKDSFEFVISRTYEFEFLHSEIPQPKICQLFSHFLFSFLLEPALCHPIPQDDCLTCSAKSFIATKKDSLTLFFNLSEPSDFLCEKTVFSKDSYLDFYLAFAQQCFFRQYFPDIKSFSIQDLLHKLIAVTMLFQNNLYLYYAEKTNQIPLPKAIKTDSLLYVSQHQLVDYLVNNRPQSPSMDTLLIPEKIAGRIQTMSTSTSAANLSGNSGSTKENFSLNSKPFVPGKIKSGNLLELGPQFIVNKTENIELEEKEDENCLHGTYEGFCIGNLEIEFTAKDPLFIILPEKEPEIIIERYRGGGYPYDRYNNRGYQSQTYYPRNQTEYRSSPRNNQYKENYESYNRPRYYPRGKNYVNNNSSKFFPSQGGKRSSYVLTPATYNTEIDYFQLILNHGREEERENFEEGQKEI